MAEVTAKPLMTLVATNRDELKTIVSRHHGRSVAVFGSVARGDEGPHSDIDLLVEFEHGASLFDQVRIGQDAAELLGHPVDVVSAGGLRPEDDDIRADAVAL